MVLWQEHWARKMRERGDIRRGKGRIKRGEEMAVLYIIGPSALIVVTI